MSRSSPHLVVVGGGYAGAIALGRLRMALPEARLTLVDPRESSEARIHLHRVAAGGGAPHVPLAAICARWGAEHVRERLVRAERALVLESGPIAADGVVLALGSRVRAPPGPAFTLNDDASARALAAAVGPGDRVTVVGAGTTALELVTALAVRHPRLRATLWTPARPWRAAIDGIVRSRLSALGVAVHAADRVVEVSPGACRAADGSRVEHDHAVWCGGFEAAITPGLGPVGPDGRVALDPFLQVRPGWFVAGDLGCPPIPHRMGCVTALPTGAWAAHNLARWARGEPLEPFAFRDLLTCTDLGGGQGLVEAAEPAWAFGGLAGGALKAGILGYVRAVLASERSARVPLYRWARPSRAEIGDVLRS